MLDQCTSHMAPAQADTINHQPEACSRRGRPGIKGPGAASLAAQSDARTKF